MRCVAVALPLSIVGVLILSSVAWACSDSERPGEMCGRDERGPPGFSGPPGSRWDRPGRDRVEWGRPNREKIERAEREDFEAKRREIQEWAEKEARKAEAKMEEAIALKRNTETLQAYMSEEVSKAKKAQEDAAQHQHDADEKAKQADDAKKRYEGVIAQFKADREHYKQRFIEILAHDPCGQTPSAPPAAGGAGTH
jgi:hypothetical protein